MATTSRRSKRRGLVGAEKGRKRAAIVLLIRGPGVAWLDDVSTDGSDPGREAKPMSVARPKSEGPKKAKVSCDPAEGFYPDYPVGQPKRYKIRSFF